jgi:hypothetical protein
MSHHKQPERRTFLEDRFEILIKRQKKGSATLSELTELDAIVNGDPQIRDRIIRESMLINADDEFNEPSNSLNLKDDLVKQKIRKQNMLSRITSLIGRLFNVQISVIKNGNIILGTKLMSFI